MRKAGVALMLAAAGGLWIGCSSSTGPAPTLVGTWHVTLGAITGGINPTTFDAVVRASGDSFLVTMPSLTWGTGPVSFDTLASISVVDDSNVAIVERTSSSTRVCDFVVLGGNANAARDTLHGASFIVADTDMTGAYICKPKAQGSATAHK